MAANLRFLRQTLAAFCLLLLCAADVVAAHRVDLSALESRIQSVVNKALPAIVSGAIKGQEQGNFSAVIVTPDGYVLTAAHCVSGKPDATYLLTLADGRTVEADALGFEKRLDCGLLKIREAGTWPTVEMGRSDGLAPNQPCVSISHPGQFNPDRGPVVRFGRIEETVSARAGMIRSTCLTEPGDSGGALLDADGRVIGIHSQIDKDLTRNYHVRIGAFTQYWDQLRTKGKFTAARTPGLPWLGLGLKAADDGLLVVSVERDGLGAAAGVQKDDVVMQMGEAGITSLPQFQNEYLKLVRAGSREVVLTVLRDDRRVSISISLPGPPQDDSLVIPELQDLASLMAGDEQRLDDVTVVISSQVGGRAASVVGTLLADGRSIVSKASRVGPAAVVKLRTGERIPLTTIGRDDGNDLILLRADTSLGRTGLAIGEPEAVQAIRRGRLLLSPLPRGPGFVSTVGSDVFESPSRSQRGYLGVRMNAQGGHVRIMSVERTSAAGRSGLRAGDVLLGVDGRDVAAPADVFGILRQKSPGDRVVLVVERDGSQIGKRIKLGTRPEPKRHAADFFSGGKSRRRDGFSLAFTHDATLKPQECGGPVFDLAGNFVGLNIARHSRAQTYAVPASVVLAFVRSQPPAPDETSSDRDGSAD